MPDHPKLPLAAWLLAACGVWLVGLGFYFVFLRPSLLPEDLRFMGTTLPQLQAASPGLAGWLKTVYTVMGGFMAGTGVLATFLALRLVPLRRQGTAWAIGLSGLLTVGLMSGANFALNSDFRWLLLVPAVVWLVAFLSYLLER